MSDLKCFRIDHPDGESCWCVTDTPEKARAISLDSVFEEEGPDFPFEVVIMEDGEPLAIFDDDTGETETKTIREWIDGYGEGTGFLCCSSSLC